MGAQQGLLQMLLPLVLFVVIFYFMIIRPQKKRQREHEKMIAGISRGDGIITIGGFFGVVKKVLDDSFIIALDENTKVRILKSSVSMRKDAFTIAKSEEKKD